MATDDGRTFLSEVTLLNFRLFETLIVPLDPRLTVIVAANGGGKTSLLDATAVGLRYFADGMLQVKQSHGFDKTDIRLLRSPAGSMVPQLPTSVVCTGDIAGQPTTWRRELASETGRTTHKDAEDLWARAINLRAELQAWSAKKRPTSPDLPVLGYYGTGRLWGEGRISAPMRRRATELDHQYSVYADCLKPSSSYSSFVLWFEAVVREAQNEREGGPPSPHRPQALLEAVRRATDVVLAPTGWSRLDWSFLSGEVVAQHEALGSLPVSCLSDGVRNTLGMVADLAHRCVRLNPHHGAEAAERSPGIVLIDEVDMHLHPAWQQTILAALQVAFPRIQLIVTTHSPQVITTVPSECVRVLDEQGVHSAPAGTQGAESSRVLKRVFGVDPRPPQDPLARDLKEYLGLVDDGQWATPRALELRARLDENFQGDEPSLLDADLRIENAEWERGA